MKSHSDISSPCSSSREHSSPPRKKAKTASSSAGLVTPPHSPLKGPPKAPTKDPPERGGALQERAKAPPALGRIPRKAAPKSQSSKTWKGVFHFFITLTERLYGIRAISCPTCDELCYPLRGKKHCRRCDRNEERDQHIPNERIAKSDWTRLEQSIPTSVQNLEVCDLDDDLNSLSHLITHIATEFEWSQHSRFPVMRNYENSVSPLCYHKSKSTKNSPAIFNLSTWMDAILLPLFVRFFIIGLGIAQEERHDLMLACLMKGKGKQQSPLAKDIASAAKFMMNCIHACECYDMLDVLLNFLRFGEHCRMRDIVRVMASLAVLTDQFADCFSKAVSARHIRVNGGNGTDVLRVEEAAITKAATLNLTVEIILMLNQHGFIPSVKVGSDELWCSPSTNQKYLNLVKEHLMMHADYFRVGERAAHVVNAMRDLPTIGEGNELSLVSLFVTIFYFHRPFGPRLQQRSVVVIGAGGALPLMSGRFHFFSLKNSTGLQFGKRIW